MIKQSQNESDSASSSAMVESVKYAVVTSGLETELTFTMYPPWQTAVNTVRARYTAYTVRVTGKPPQARHLRGLSTANW